MSRIYKRDMHVSLLCVYFIIVLVSEIGVESGWKLNSLRGWTKMGFILLCIIHL